MKNSKFRNLVETASETRRKSSRSKSSHGDDDDEKFTFGWKTKCIAFAYVVFVLLIATHMAVLHSIGGKVFWFNMDATFRAHVHQSWMKVLWGALITAPLFRHATESDENVFFEVISMCNAFT